MRDLIEQLTELHEKVASTGGYFDLDRREEEIHELEQTVSAPGFWKDPSHAQGVTKRLDELKTELTSWRELDHETKESILLAEEAEASGEHEVRGDIERKLHELRERFFKLEFFVLLSGKYDKENAIVALHAGTGGTDAQDWAGMLLRMYLRFCEQRGWTARVLDESRGQEAGIKSATIEVLGRYAYGYLKAEAGVHRLVRISPFDAEAMRHTSFALVEVLPEMKEIEEIVIDPKDLRIDTFMSSGHGGQSVNTTYSAVRIVHLPTKITVTCQNERSQTQNRETAMKILKARLHQMTLAQQQEEKQALRGEYTEAAWGNQIRSYVLHPYKMVKDHRTKYETTDPDAVLDGKLDPFIEACLRQRATR
ncbi:MAG: peptide chain release factor 2 [bacterium]